MWEALVARNGEKRLDLMGKNSRIRGFAADVAELADALASGASGGNPVEVRILSSALACNPLSCNDLRASLVSNYSLDIVWKW